MKIKDKKTGKVKDVKLPKAFKNKWIKALRSGEYSQTKRKLQDKDGYCCLGVACRIIHPYMHFGTSGLITKQNIKVPKLLKGVAEKSDKMFNPVVAKLTFMNDDGKSFKQIANYIEKNL